MDKLSTETLAELKQILTSVLERADTSVVKDDRSLRLLWDIYIDQTGDTELLDLAWQDRIDHNLKQLVFATLCEAKSKRLIEYGHNLVRKLAYGDSCPTLGELDYAAQFLEVMAMRNFSTKDLETYVRERPGWFYKVLPKLCRAMQFCPSTASLRSASRTFQECVTILEQGSFSLLKH